MSTTSGSGIILAGRGVYGSEVEGPTNHGMEHTEDDQMSSTTLICVMAVVNNENEYRTTAQAN